MALTLLVSTFEGKLDVSCKSRANVAYAISRYLKNHLN